MTESKWRFVVRPLFLLTFGIWIASACSERTESLGPKSIEVVGSSNGWQDGCQAIDVQLQTFTGLVVPAREYRTLNVSVDTGSLYSDNACSTAITTVSFNPATSSQTIYFESSTAAVSTITATGNDLTSGSLAITVRAHIVIGQPNMTSNTANNGGISASTLSGSYNAFRIGDHLFVADTGNHRVLIWTSAPNANGEAADIVLGQPNMTANSCIAPTAQTLCNPTYVHSDGTRLLVADSGNSRILIWNTIPTTDAEAADLVLGQPNMTTNTYNNGGTSAQSLAAAEAVVTNGTRVFVSDNNNNRILVWNSFPTADQEAADVVIGQPDMTSDTSGGDADSLNYPYMAVPSNGSLLVSDYGNNRVLVWNSIPTNNGTAADFAIGQPDLTTVAAPIATAADTLNQPGDIAVDSDGRVFISDYGANRVVIWNQMPTASGASADDVIGQPDLTSDTANNGGLSETSLSGPWGLSILDDEIWITDLDNHRVLRSELP